MGMMQFALTIALSDATDRGSIMWKKSALALLVSLVFVVITIRDLARNASDDTFSGDSVGIFSSENIADYAHELPLRAGLLALIVIALCASSIYRRARYRNLLKARKKKRISQKGKRLG